MLHLMSLEGQPLCGRDKEEAQKQGEAFLYLVDGEYSHWELGASDLCIRCLRVKWAKDKESQPLEDNTNPPFGGQSTEVFCRY